MFSAVCSLLEAGVAFDAGLPHASKAEADDLKKGVREVTGALSKPLRALKEVRKKTRPDN